MPNQATVPALEGVSPASIKGVDCEKLKAEFGVETGTHGENRKGPTKKNSREYQSHHILQDAQTNSIIGRDAAMAVLLYDSHAGTEHGDITSRQNERMNNKKSGVSPGPASNLGELKKQAKGDLMAGLEHRRKEKKKSKKKLKQLADCLVAEAEKELKKAYKKKKNGQNATNKTEVDPPGECLSADTVLWLANGNSVLAANLTSGMQIETLGGPMQIIRTDQCRSELLEIEVLGAWVALAPFHRVLTAYGYYARADHLRPGHEVLTVNGKATITEIRSNRKPVPVYNFGVGQQTGCKVGSVGLWVEVTDTGPPVIRRETVSPFCIKEIAYHAEN